MVVWLHRKPYKVRVFAWTFDAGYGRDGEFLDGLQKLGQNYVAEVPCDFTGMAGMGKVKQRSKRLSPKERAKRREKKKKSGKVFWAAIADIFFEMILINALCAI